MGSSVTDCQCRWCGSERAMIDADDNSNNVWSVQCPDCGYAYSRVDGVEEWTCGRPELRHVCIFVEAHCTICGCGAVSTKGGYTPDEWDELVAHVQSLDNTRRLGRALYDAALYGLDSSFPSWMTMWCIEQLKGE